MTKTIAVVKAPAVLGRPTKYTKGDIKQWVELRQHGLTYREIAEMRGVPQKSLSHYIRKYTEAVAN